MASESCGLRPCLAVNRVPDRRATYPIARRKLPLRETSLLAAYGSHLCRGQPRPTIVFAGRNPAPGVAIVHVVPVGTRYDVARITARRVVACVPAHRHGPRSGGEKICKPVGVVRPRVPSRSSVAVLVNGARPGPALIGTFDVDIAPEPSDSFLIHWNLHSLGSRPRRAIARGHFWPL